MPAADRSSLRRTVYTAEAIAIVAMVGWLDYQLGPEIALEMVYLMPVVWIARAFGFGASMVTTCAVALVSVIADVATRHPQKLQWSDLWNDLTVVVVCLALGLLTARLAQANAQLQVLLEREATLARTDGVTGLANARAFLDTLGSQLARSQREPQPLCVAYLDLDNFKSVNDARGHAAGDELLRRVASALRETVRAGDVPARLGGDEFAVLFWDMRADAVREVAHRLVARIAEVATDYPEVELGVSVGLAAYETPPADPEAVVRKADAAMYVAKGLGTNRVMIWAQDSGEVIAG